MRGASALEFALVLPLMVLLLYGIVSFGAVFYSQMALSRAAEDAARAVTFLPKVANGQTQDYTPIKTEVVNSLSASLIVPAASNGSVTTRRAWLQTHVQGAVNVAQGACSGASATCVTITITYPYQLTWILLPISLPFSSGNSSMSSWLPTTLVGQAVVRIS